MNRMQSPALHLEKSYIPASIRLFSQGLQSIVITVTCTYSYLKKTFNSILLPDMKAWLQAIDVLIEYDLTALAYLF